jgi:hypothetical protein
MPLSQGPIRHALVVLASIVLCACASQKEPAQTAVNTIDGAVSAVAAEAAKYVPDQLADVQAQLGNLKTLLDKQDYQSVIAGAPAVSVAVQALANAASAKKDEVAKAMSAEWTSLAERVPAAVNAVQNRLDTLSKMKSKKLPNGVDLAAARSALGDANSLWSKAQAAFSGANIEEAVNTAKQVKTKVEAAAAALKLDLNPPAPATAFGADGRR